MTATDVRVNSEPLTYREDVGDSFFHDFAVAQLRKTDRNAAGARARLERHQLEMEVEKRANPRSALGFGGEFDPPMWAIDKFATAARAGRVIADLVPNLVLPFGYDSVHVPVFSTGAADGIQTDDNTTAASTDEVTGDVPNTSVVTVAGNVDASQQILDRVPPPGYDGIVYTDLMRGYNQSLEQQLTFGTGLAGQLTGVTQVTGRQTDVDGSGTSATQATGVPTLKILIGRAMASVGNGRKLPVDNLIMAIRRWAWIATDVSEIAQTQLWPLPGFPSVGTEQETPVGAQVFAGLPTYQSGSCMSGAATASDVIVALRSTDMLLYESSPKFVVMENPLSGTLRVRLQMRRYVAFPIRRAAGIACVTGIPAPTNFGA